MLGNRIRQARQSRRLSLSEVATRAKISVATLSRIERDKQGIDLGMFITLSKILKTPATELLGSENAAEVPDPLSAQIARLDSPSRTQLWKELAVNARANRYGRTKMNQLNSEVEELLAQIDFLRDEIRSVQKRLTSR